MKRNILQTGLAAVVAVAALAALNAQAQTVYRIVGPDGKVTFSDKRPSTGDTENRDASMRMVFCKNTN